MPPKSCPSCAAPMKKKSVATSEGTGCIVIILGIVLTPLIIGIPVIVAGVYLMSKTEKYWLCKNCGQRIER